MWAGVHCCVVITARAVGVCSRMEVAMVCCDMYHTCILMRMCVCLNVYRYDHDVHHCMYVLALLIVGM